MQLFDFNKICSKNSNSLSAHIQQITWRKVKTNQKYSPKCLGSIQISWYLGTLAIGHHTDMTHGRLKETCLGTGLDFNMEHLIFLLSLNFPLCPILRDASFQYILIFSMAIRFLRSSCNSHSWSIRYKYSLVTRWRYMVSADNAASILCVCILAYL